MYYTTKHWTNETVNLLGVVCNVEVEYDVFHQHGSYEDQAVDIRKVIGVGGVDLYNMLSAPASMEVPQCFIHNAKVYWHGCTDLDLLYETIQYKVSCGDLT